MMGIHDAFEEGEENLSVIKKGKLQGEEKVEGIYSAKRGGAKS